jgi:predicted O-linked N-acetylglucosamine transferase (SPINDLY family)
MADFSTSLAAALEHHLAGRVRTAEQSYLEILETEPANAQALHFLGVLETQLERYDDAVRHIRMAIDIHGADAAFHCNLGNALKSLGQVDAAVLSFRRAIELNPDLVEAHTNLGNALKDLRKLEEAVASHRRALFLRPDLAEVHNNLGAVLKELGEIDQAIACHQCALRLKPDFAEAHNNLGTAFKERGRLDEALTCYRRALELKPDYPEAYANAGTVLKEQGKLSEAANFYERALHLKPTMAEVFNGLGAVLKEQGKHGAALVCHRRALDLDPTYADAYCNLGSLLWEQGNMEEAAACQRRALELRPQPQAHSNLLLTLQYCPGITLADLATAHSKYEQIHAAQLVAVGHPHTNDRDSERRLRLGFVSPDFGQHPVGYFVMRPLEKLDRGACETFCYSDRITKDEITARLQVAAGNWRDINGVSDQALAQTVRDDRIDILFDLAGHTGKNRLLVFARKPAPIQVTWLGYAGTTGLTAIDYLLADECEVPRGAENHYVEKILRMPDGYICYDPPPYAPPVASLPAATNGYVTFGSFNNPAKITPRVLEVWAAVLRRVPYSRLVLKYRGIGDDSVASRIKDGLSTHGIDPSQIDCFGWSPHPLLLEEYNRVDLALDSFPYNGGLTTCEALWMGVPVVTCPGETFVSRHSLSHLTTVGLTQTIARDLDEYIELAVSLAADLPALANLRATLRQQMSASPLCNGQRFADNLLRLLRDAWRQWCSHPQ